MKKIYFAGDLFNHKDLFGNQKVKEKLEAISEYEVMLPQDSEQTQTREKGIRDSDLSMVAKADLCIFNFDGTDLDSGTVVEFMVAKNLDIPSVILRTDFRSAGDGVDACGNPWNLMASFYPRTNVILQNAMVEYKNCKGDSDIYYTKLAKQLHDSLVAVDKESSLLTPAEKNNMLASLEKLYDFKFQG
jgi:nucleoside 2-deoxyribosyltransferase